MGRGEGIWLSYCLVTLDQAVMWIWGVGGTWDPFKKDFMTLVKIYEGMDQA
jgi:hypothetical protein